MATVFNNRLTQCLKIQQLALVPQLSPLPGFRQSFPMGLLGLPLVPLCPRTHGEAFTVRLDDVTPTASSTLRVDGLQTPRRGCRGALASTHRCSLTYSLDPRLHLPSASCCRTPTSAVLSTWTASPRSSPAGSLSVISFQTLERPPQGPPGDTLSQLLLCLQACNRGPVRLP